MTRALIAAVMLSGLSGCIAVTNPDDRVKERGYNYRGDWRAYHRETGHWDPRRDGRYERRKYPHPGYNFHSWRRGERLPAAYYAYRIDDYRRCGLRTPSRGAQWIRINHDAVLAAITTGLVLDVVYNAFR
jgi:Ni/Co efflux regulator RcnB